MQKWFEDLRPYADRHRELQFQAESTGNFDLLDAWSEGDMCWGTELGHRRED